MIDGQVDLDGVPMVVIPVGGQDWPAVIDTGFNGDRSYPSRCVLS